jgi:uncharacterized membrane protein
MTNLIAASAYFLLIHLLVSGTRVRNAIIARVGAGPYMGLFVVASFAGLIWMGWAYALVRYDEANSFFWGVTPAMRVVQIVLQLIAFFFIVAGQMTPNPTGVRAIVPNGPGAAMLDKPDLVTGMLRITRHPFLWGVAIWATGHIIVNGDTASLILFGSLLILALIGPALIDGKRVRQMGDRYREFMARTSNAPFAAILSGRQKLSFGEIGWRRVLAGVAVWAVLGLAHPYLFGVRAFP